MIELTQRVRAAALAVAALVGLALLAPPVLAAGGDAPVIGVVNVNVASAEELQLLPGIGESRAQAILELRKQKGGFRSVEELAEVKGIGSVALERLRPYVTVKGKTTARAR